jgi:hypothetical protein
MRVAASLAISDNAFSRWKCRDFRWSDSGAVKVRTWADPLQEHPGISFQRPEARKHDVDLPNSTIQRRARHTWLTGSAMTDYDRPTDAHFQPHKPGMRPASHCNRS